MKTTIGDQVSYPEGYPDDFQRDLERAEKASMRWTFPKLSTRDPRTMPGPDINRELDRLSEHDSEFGTAMIDAGRGRECPNEWLAKTDPLALRGRAIWERRMALKTEIELRAGPGVYRLPPGFGPRPK